MLLGIYTQPKNKVGTLCWWVISTLIRLCIRTSVACMSFPRLCLNYGTNTKMYYKLPMYSMSKIITLEEAAEKVKSGCKLGIGGTTLYRRPVAFTRALLQYFRRTGEPFQLTLITFTAGFESDLLVGAGLVDTVRTCYFGLEIFGFAPMFTYRANAGSLNILEETETSLALGLRAQMASVGFMPGRAWIGTDLLKLRPDVQTVIDPYSGETLVAFPAIHPDISIIHALRADPDGNAQIGDNKGVDEELAIASEYVIVTAEEIVPELSILRHRE